MSKSTSAWRAILVRTVPYCIKVLKRILDLYAEFKDGVPYETLDCVRDPILLEEQMKL